MNEEQIRQLFRDVDDVLAKLQETVLEAMLQEIDAGTLSATVGMASVKVQWPHPYSETKLELKLSVEAGIPREGES